jgi:imidazolonepropionase-like amidohydrolase
MTEAQLPRPDLVIRDVAVLDCTGAEPSGRHDVVVRDGRIDSIHRHGEGATVRDATEVDGSGTTLMPGLTDAHVHFALIGQKGDHGDEPLIDHVLRSQRTSTARSTRASRRSATRAASSRPGPRRSRRASSAARGSCPRAPSCRRRAVTAMTARPTMPSITVRRSPA